MLCSGALDVPLEVEEEEDPPPAEEAQEDAPALEVKDRPEHRGVSNGAHASTLYIYIYIYIIHVYNIYIYIERERDTHIYVYIYIHIHIHVYIHIHIFNHLCIVACGARGASRPTVDGASWHENQKRARQRALDVSRETPDVTTKPERYDLTNILVHQNDQVPGLRKETRNHDEYVSLRVA